MIDAYFAEIEQVLQQFPNILRSTMTKYEELIGSSVISRLAACLVQKSGPAAICQIFHTKLLASFCSGPLQYR
jgi:hypothetical protein